ncbi:hypothetical protein DFH08DRAFT_821047 [Mycena albidolilacea]|uniref:Uncharacterized protein n=1 Tax=Mycena albidolilacea TaxID=1033008 RepID=A0AAD6ZAM1_9AGAR|nr:hypothetical protein DFH08DRAFT_821047 [Mycena albidolilacea]
MTGHVCKWVQVVQNAGTLDGVLKESKSKQTQVVTGRGMSSERTQVVQGAGTLGGVVKGKHSCIPPTLFYQPQIYPGLLNLLCDLYSNKSESLQNLRAGLVTPIPSVHFPSIHRDLCALPAGFTCNSSGDLERSSAAEDTELDVNPADLPLATRRAKRNEKAPSRYSGEDMRDQTVSYTTRFINVPTYTITYHTGTECHLANVRVAQPTSLDHVPGMDMIDGGASLLFLDAHEEEPDCSSDGRVPDGLGAVAPLHSSVSAEQTNTTQDSNSGMSHLSFTELQWNHGYQGGGASDELKFVRTDECGELKS